MDLILYQEAKEDPVDSDVSLQAIWFLEIMITALFTLVLILPPWFQAEDNDDDADTDAEDDAAEDTDAESKDDAETKEDEKHVGFLTS